MLAPVVLAPALISNSAISLTPATTWDRGALWPQGDKKQRQKGEWACGRGTVRFWLASPAPQLPRLTKMGDAYLLPDLLELPYTNLPLPPRLGH